MTALTVSSLTKIAEGREAEIFAFEPGVVLKLYRTNAWLRSRDIERAAMEAVRGAGGPVPAARGTIEIDGRPGLLMERIDGIDMLSELEKKPWRIVSTGGVIGRIHAELNKTPAPVALEGVKELLTRRIEELRHIRPDLCDRGLGALGELPDGDRLCHGDFHPGNVIATAGAPVVIDWPNAMHGDPAADVARTSLLLRLGDLPPGSPALLRLLAKVGRSFLHGRYLAAYRRASPIDSKLVERWIVPVAIARLTEGIEAERPKILKLLGAQG